MVLGDERRVDRGREGVEDDDANLMGVGLDASGEGRQPVVRAASCEGADAVTFTAPSARVSPWRTRTGQ